MPDRSHALPPPVASSAPAAAGSAWLPTTARCLTAVVVSLLLLPGDAASQFRLPEWLTARPSTGLSEGDAGRGVKEALVKGVTRAVLNLHRTDGFFGSELYKLLLPPDAARAERTLRRVGLGREVDRAILAINRGAEDAVGTAGPIFTRAIREMTVTDAIGIVKGEEQAATMYFRRKTSEQLVAAFSPSVAASLERVHATKYYADIAHTYNRLPLTSDRIDPDLTAYVVGKAIDALFDQIAKEEADIRTNPLARTTDILRKVFGIR